MLQEIEKTLHNSGSYRIVFLGDSIVSCEWIHPNWREIVEYVIKEELQDTMEDYRVPSWGVRCFNAGFDGSGTDDIAKMLDQEVLRHNPHMVIWFTTGNDILYNVSVSEHVEKIQTIIDQLRDKTQLVVCTSVSKGNKRYDETYGAYAETLAQKFPQEGVQFIDLYKILHKYDGDKMYDLVNMFGNKDLHIKPGDIDYAHPGILGNAYIAKIVLQEVYSIFFDPERYLDDIKNKMMFPQYKPT